MRELLTYPAHLKPKNDVVLASFEAAAGYNQTLFMYDFLQMRFGETYRLTQDNIDGGLVNATIHGHQEAVQAIMKHNRAIGIPFPSKEAILYAKNRDGFSVLKQTLEN